MNALIIVPAFNESQVIYKVIKSLPKKLNQVSTVKHIVINDGSTDDTAKEAKKAKSQVISHVVNRGLGAAIKTGLAFAKKKRVDIAITFDGDGQHDPKDIQKVVDPIINKNAEIVIGSRFKSRQRTPLDRFILNWLANVFTFSISGAISSDSQSGLRAFSKNAIKKINFKADRMEFSSEIIIEAKKNAIKVQEVPIKAIYTKYSREKGQKNTNAFPVFSRLLVKFLR